MMNRISALFDRGSLSVVAENALLLMSDRLMRIPMCADC